MYYMIPLGVGAGFYTAKKIAGKKTGEKGRFPSLRFGVHDYDVHLHHWLWAMLLIIGILLFVDIVYNRFSLFSLGLLGGFALQGIYCYDDWHNVIKKKRRE